MEGIQSLLMLRVHSQRQRHVTGDGVAEVGELVYHFQGVVAEGDCRGGVDILAHDVFFKLMVRTISLHASAKQEMTHQKVSSEWGAGAASSAKSISLISTLCTLVFSLS